MGSYLLLSFLGIVESQPLDPMEFHSLINRQMADDKGVLKADLLTLYVAPLLSLQEKWPSTYSTLLEQIQQCLNTPCFLISS